MTVRGRVLDRFSVTEQRVVAALLTVVAILVLASRPPDVPQTVDVDHLSYARAVEHMRDGLGYHEAMQQSMVETLGEPRNVRAFRPPTMFWAWQAGHGWWVYVGFLAATMLALAWLLDRPLVVPLVATYLTVNAYPLLDRGWQAQWLALELWAAPLMLLTVALAWRGRDRPGAVAGTLAALVREHGALVLAGGLLSAWRARRPVWPWAAGLLVFVAFFGWHVWSASGLFVPGGSEPPAMEPVPWMAGFGLPWPLVSGWLLVAAAVWRSRAEWLTLPVLALPLLGLVVGRPYWGLMIVPVAMLAVTRAGGESAGPAGATRPPASA